ncbi:ABC transporter ATP-binding protein [Candidatus Spongiihabitans sp.]|uniref:ABC transporter ATP-binding protein n=1 Tax=Candidatus Spongiihabitans sp. TaxID=3101308 RepID=UPI003C701B36
MSELLSLKNVSLFYDHVHALRDVSLHLDEGETIALIGANGAGISMAPEGRHVFPYMSVKDNLLMGAFTRKDKAGIAEDLHKVLEKFPRLRERFHQSASTLSGGEQQMMVIGRALMSRPKVLLLDEPSLGIAPKLVQSIARSIVAINRDDHVSVILVEQNSRMAMRISHRTYALTTGEIVISGNSADLQNDDRIRKLYLGGDTA